MDVKELLSSFLYVKNNQTEDKIGKKGKIRINLELSNKSQ